MRETIATKENNLNKMTIHADQLPCYDANDHARAMKFFQETIKVLHEMPGFYDDRIVYSWPSIFIGIDYVTFQPLYTTVHMNYDSNTQTFDLAIGTDTARYYF